MGISLKDLGSFATGAIERDRELTSEKFKIRADELKANRDMIIAMKKDKYAADIAEYKKENEKAKEIKSLNATAFNAMESGKGKLSDEAYAKRFLMAEIGADKYKNLFETDKDGFDAMIANYASLGPRKYNNTIDRESLDTNFKAEAAVVAKTFANELEAAKGDSFLINKILRRKSNVESNLSDVVEDKINASKKVVDRDELDINKIQLAETKKSRRSPSKEYNSTWDSAYNNIDFDLDAKNNKSFKYLNKFSSIGGANEGSLKFNKVDSKIEGHNANSIVNLLAMERMFTSIRDSKDAVGAYNINKQPTSIKKNFNVDTVFNEMSNLITEGRATNIDGSIRSEGTNQYALTAIVPLSVVGMDGQIKLGEGTFNIKKEKLSMKNIAENMGEFIKIEAAKINDKNMDSQSKVSSIYTELFENNPQTVNDFKNYLYEKDPTVKKFYDNLLLEKQNTSTETNTTENNNTTNSKPIENKSVDTVPKVIYKTKQIKGKKGLVINGKFNTWGAIEKADAVKDLPPAQKAEYDKWKVEGDFNTFSGNANTSAPEVKQ